MPNFATSLNAINVNLSDLLLDPNNPRFSDLGEEYNEIKEARFADEKVQKTTLSKMRDGPYDVADLRDTIKTMGFLPMDRIVLRKWNGESEDPKYVVIEGNRRVSALKWLMELEDEGKETFTDEERANLNDLECLELDPQFASPEAQLILPGLRHVSGIKEWRPYQKAKAVNALRKLGMDSREAAQSLGLSTKAANNAYRCFVALENMKADKDYGDAADPRMYSFFEEVFKKPELKTWLGWSDEAEEFQDNERLQEFYNWITPPINDDEGEQKLKMAIHVRDLAKIINEPTALAVFKSHDGGLKRAMLKFEVDHPEDWYPKIIEAIAAIKNLPIHVVKDMDDETRSSLTALRDQINETLKDRDVLKSEVK